MPYPSESTQRYLYHYVLVEGGLSCLVRLQPSRIRVNTYGAMDLTPHRNHEALVGAALLHARITLQAKVQLVSLGNHQM